MTTRSVLIYLFCLNLAFLARAQEPPNILFIAFDDLRPELNAYGASHMITPNFDKFAGQGRLFLNHYVAVPTCGASRYALMSGLFPTSSTDGNSAFKSRMPTSLPTNSESWVDLLRRNGWHTASIGKITHEPDGFIWSNNSGTYDYGRTRATNAEMRFSWNEIIWDHGKWGAQRYPLFAYADGTGRVKVTTPAYESGQDAQGVSLPDEAYPDGLMALAAIDKLAEFAEEGTRFCLALGFFRPHLPFNAPKAYFDLYDPAALPGPSPASAPIGNNYMGSSGEVNSYTDNRDIAKLRHAYFASVSYVDAQLGKVLSALDSLGLADNTMVVLWGDHGWLLGDYGGGRTGKHRVLERALEAPLIIRAPQAWNPVAYAGLPTAGVVSTIDIYPTIAEVCGLTPPSGIDGSSLVPMLRNPYAPGKDHAFSRFNSARSVRTSEWRLIDNGKGDTDLYDLTSFRYELTDVSAANQSIISNISGRLLAAGKRDGRTYAEIAGANPLLVNPEDDGDGDGVNNIVEIGTGTDPLDPGARPQFNLTVDDLVSEGFGQEELVFQFTLSNKLDDFVFKPEASVDLVSWGFTNLEFIDAEAIGENLTRFRYRIMGDAPENLFLRLEGQF